MQIMLGSGLVFVEVGVQFNNFHQIYFTVTNISATLGRKHSIGGVNENQIKLQGITKY